jgi:hypothetical protein
MRPQKNSGNLKSVNTAFQIFFELKRSWFGSFLYVPVFVKKGAETFSFGVFYSCNSAISHPVHQG